MSGQYYNASVELMVRDSLNELIDERVRYTVQYAARNSPFYQKWFRENKIRSEDIREHQDLLNLLIISGLPSSPPENAVSQSGSLKITSRPILSAASSNCST